MTDVQIAIQIHPQQADYSAIRDAAQQAEDMGFDIVYNWDHFYPLYGDPDGEHFECWTMLAAWAEQTSRIEIGALVTCNSYRNPQLLADMARTVDHISDGRLLFGIGSGWFQRDYDEYGYEFGTAPSRLRDLDKNMPIIKERWAKLNPPPTREIPIVIGGGGEKVTLRIVAEHAHVWHWFPESLEMLDHKNSVLDSWCAKVGRDPAEITRSMGLHPHQIEKGMKYADDYYDRGVREISLGFGGPTFDIASAARWLEWRDAKNA